jgi:long-chain fatty acid transport protein
VGASRARFRDARSAWVRTLALVAVVSAAVQSGGAAGNGFFIPQQGAGSIGRSFAGDTALARDATTAFFNPAGMVHLDGGEIVVGASLLRPTVDFGNRGSSASTPGTLGASVPYPGGDGGDPGSWAPAPHAFAAVPLKERVWAGLALAAPFGLGLDYDDDWFGRYDSIETELLTLDVSPVLAFELISDVLAIGGGLNLRYADVRLTRAVPDTLAPGGPSLATDGRSELDGSGWNAGFNVAAHLQLEATRLGLQYRSGFEHELDGSFDISGLHGALAAANGDFDATTVFETPGVLSLGVVHAMPAARLRLLGEVRYFDWSRFDAVRVALDGGAGGDLVLPQDHHDSFTVALGLEYDLIPDRRDPFGSRAVLTLRAGAQYDRTPTDDELRNTSLPDADRLWLGIGATWRLSERLSIDVAGSYAFFRDADIDLERTFFEGTPAEGTVNIAGVAEPNFGTLALDVRWQF